MSHCSDFLILGFNASLKIIHIDSGYVQTIKFDQNLKLLKLLSPEPKHNIFDVICKNTDELDGEITIHRVHQRTKEILPHLNDLTFQK